MMGIEPPANTEFFARSYGITHVLQVKWARECGVNLKIGMFVNHSEEWAQRKQRSDLPTCRGLWAWAPLV